MARSILLGSTGSTTSGTTTATSLSQGISWGAEGRTAAGGWYLLVGISIGNSLSTNVTATASYAGNNMTSLGKIANGSGTTAGFTQMFGLDMGPLINGSATIPRTGNVVVNVSSASTIICGMILWSNAYGGAQSVGTTNNTTASATASFSVNAGANAWIFDMMGSKYPVNSVSGGHLQYYGSATNTATNGGNFSLCAGQATGTAQTWNWGFTQATLYGYALGLVAGTDNDPATTDAATFSESSSILAWDNDNVDSGTLTDSSSLYYTNQYASTDAATESETSLVGPRTTDTAALSETSAIYPTNFISTSDSATQTDSSGPAPFATSPTSDSATQTEQTTTSYVTSATSDFPTLSESNTRAVTQSTTDAATFTDTSVVFKGDAVISTSDPATLTDTSSLTTTRSTSDIATGTDTSTANTRATTTTDNAALTDSSTYSNVNATSDSATVTDNSNVSSATPIIGMETPSVTDTSSITSTRPTSDIAGASESSAVSIVLSTTDTAALTDASQSVNVRTSDSSTLNEATRQINQARSDTFGLSESSMISISTSDAAATTETRQSGPKTSDILLFSDVSQSGNNKTYTADLLSLIEQTYIFATQSTSDVPFAFDENDNVAILPINYDDPFTYPDTTIHNKNFRVLAQDHFTRKFLSWDLPVDNVKITYTLSGPALFQGVLSTEMQSVVDMGLQPDRTWLYVEEDGEIQGAFMLTPFVDNPQTETRLIEGEGFASYPHWITYEGDPFVGIQVDPADMIRKLWNHVQSFPDGNLGVNVGSLTTPVKIGEPPQSVNFYTSAGNLVSFQKGPYNLNFWSSINCGEEIEKLCKEAPIEFYEVSMWNDTKTDVELYLILGWPRVGTRRGDLGFREGENITQLIPSYQETQENYASDVLVIGAGNGPTAIRAKHSERIGRFRKTNVITNQDITTVKRAQSIADFEFNRISKSRFLIQSLTVDLTHDNSVWGSFACGDDIFVEATVDYVGLVQAWYRITSYTYDPYFKTATLSLSPSESFTYGAENVDPYNNLPTAGFAKLAKTQDFSKLFDPKQQTIDQSQLMAAVAQQAQQLGCDYFNNHGIASGECIYYYYVTTNPPTGNCFKAPLSILADTTKILVIAKDDTGHIITGDNILLISTDGTVGQQANDTSDIQYPNPYYVPTSTSTGTSNGAGATSTDNAAAAQGITMARAYAMDHKNNLANGRGYYYTVDAQNAVAVVDYVYPKTDRPDLILIVAKNSNGGLMYGDNVASANASSPSGLKQAAQEILNASNQGKQVFEDFSFKNCSANVSQWNDTLSRMYNDQGGKKYGFTGFLQAVISGRLVP